MGTPTEWTGRIIAITPCGIPDALLAAAAGQAGALGVLDLGSGDRRALDQLTQAAEAAPGRPLGVRITADCRATPTEVAERTTDLEVVILGGDASWSIAAAAEHWTVLVEVTSLAEAKSAQAAGASGLIARGSESGGRTGELGTFVLLQQLLKAVTLPVWACGGIGPATAAAAVTGGAAGVVLDIQLALLAESGLPEAIRAAITQGKTGPAIGQDAYLATEFAERHGSTARAVRAVEDAIRRPVTAVAVAPGSGLAQAMGTALPIAQGPMTRVSDQAGFARAVADAGALPFLALALSSGAQTRSLLDQTRAELGDRPWGVGVLGFAPDELRAAQLEAIREFRPAAALIAGGRPDQAAELEEVGIATFLHAPSPALLRQFLAAGARRFVFEGAECGGHVGPRTSFCLWQAAIDVLLEFAHPEQLHVLFAGGIHDARSAAMVSAATAPLTERGARIGVLMGTAYLFTAEAVTHGAIQPLFQRQAVEAEATVVLETAPGHVTRCLPSPFTGQFDRLRRDLLDQGTADREVWRRLEDLNVGRLRIASKGLRREGELLVAADETVQHDEGLFMAGQVAVLRNTTTDIAALHRDVTDGAVDFLTGHATPARVTERTDAPPLDVAIVGMSAMFPGAADLPTFWANILANVDTITEVPAERWDPELYYTQDSKPSTGEHTYSKWGGFLPRIPFDALTHGIPPAALASIEPVQLLALEAAQRALLDAGYGTRPFHRDRTSVIFGAESGSDLTAASTLRMLLRGYLGSIPSELDEQLPRLTEDSFPGKLANVIAGRIANRLDLGGANYTVDAACGSSLAAVDTACKELASGSSDVVLCGGADLHNGIEDFLLFSSVGALSATGRCRPFDADGDGIALGEGVACVVLKRLADAERDGDRVYAVIKGIGSGSDGRALGLTAPRPEGQRRALDRAYRNARLTPAQVGLVEAHGTGTVVGDRTELTTLTEVFAEAGATPGNTVLGSVKSQIGHTKCTAGMAGLIKAALAVHTGVLPPTRIGQPNPAWTAGESPFAFRTEPSPWTAPATGRVAGVSAFGFGGTNFHLVLSGHTSAELNRHAQIAWPAELFLIRGADAAAATRTLTRLRGLLSTNDTHGRPWALRDFAATAAAWAARETTPIQLSFVAKDLDDLTALLDAAIAGQTRDRLFRSAEPEGQVAVLFPGQGSQRPGMLAELFVAFPDLHRLARLGGPEVAAMFPPAAFDAAGIRAQKDELRDTRLAQPALGIAGLALYELLLRSGLEADMFAGHSYGELVALTAAGALDPPVLLELSAARAEAILTAAGDDPGAMAAVAASPADIEKHLADGVVIANQNAPGQTVLSGPSAALDATVTALRDARIATTPLPVACAFHSPIVAAAGEKFGTVLAKVPVSAPDRPVWTNRTATPYAFEPDAVRAELAAQIGSPVRFTTEIERMYAAGARIFVEAGPGAVLGGLVGKILGDRPHTVISLGQHGLPGFLTGLAQLAAAGADLRTGWLHAGRPGQDLTFAEPPAQPNWTIDGQLVRTRDGRPIPGGLTPARRVTLVPTTGTDPGMSTHSGREALVADFLRTSRELIAAQRDVMLGYLGSDAPALPAAPVVHQERPAPEPEPVPEAEVDPLTAVVTVIARRTGYPPEMIDPELDLEADLSVDSIKRTEIAGELAGQDSTLVQELVRSRTANAMALALTGTPAAEPEPEITGQPPTRHVLEPTDAPLPDTDPTALVGATIAILGGDPAFAEELADYLSTNGAVPIVAADLPEAKIDGLISLHALATGEEPTLPDTFPVFKSALPDLRWCVAVASEGPQSWGLRGFFRSLHREYPETLVRLIETNESDTETLVDAITAELRANTGEPVILLGDQRQALTLNPAPLTGIATSGAGPAGDGAADLAAAGLDNDSVILLVGGARGITAKVAAALAAATKCRIELAGRTTPNPDPEPADLAAATDLPALRTALTAHGLRNPQEIDRRAKEILALREVKATLTELRAHGSLANYHTVDATDPEAISRLVKQIHTENGRLDSVIYAAGIIEDRLVADKTPESFARVYRTKVEGARALLAACDDLPDRPGSVIFFGSIAAVLGNRGQTDYAAANDALETMSASWPGRAMTVHWGPWAPHGQHGGMVSPDLARTYGDRGIALLHPEAAVTELFRELAWGTQPAALYTASLW